MKRTDLDRRERELKRAKKKEERLEKGEVREAKSVGAYIDELNGLFFHDGNKIYNSGSDEKILELLEDMKEDLEEKHWDNVLRKALKKSGVKEREKAYKELMELLV